MDGFFHQTCFYSHRQPYSLMVGAYITSAVLPDCYGACDNSISRYAKEVIQNPRGGEKISHPKKSSQSHCRGYLFRNAKGSLT